jgi:hypothetical protein
LANAPYVDVFLTCDPATGTIGFAYRVASNNNVDIVSFGTPYAPKDVMRWFSRQAQAGVLVSNQASKISIVGGFQTFHVVAAFPPGGPTAVLATAGPQSAQVSFTAPAADGSPISSYTVTATDQTTPANGGQTASGPGSPITVSGLTSGDTYTFTVTATNAIGTGPPSAPSNAVVVL